MKKYPQHVQKIITSLTKQHGAKHRADITSGVQACWRVWDVKRDGNAKDFSAFCHLQYVAPGKAKLALMKRLDELRNVIGGGMGAMMKVIRAGLDIADTPLTPAEQLIGSFTPSSHLQEDFRNFKLTQLVQLNFGTQDRSIPKTREGWVARRLSEWGVESIPPKMIAEASTIFAEVDTFVSSYNLHLDAIDFGDPDVTFPKGTCLVSHWGLRDYMMELYDVPHGLKKQRAILDLMRCVVDGDIPADILSNPQVRWHKAKGTLHEKGKPARKAKGHGPLRWEKFRKGYLAVKKMDPYTRYGNMIDNKFFGDREMEEARVVKVLTDILGSPVAKGIGKYLENKFERPLEPFDIYFKDFLAGTSKPKLRFDIAKKYGSAEALQKAIPSILLKFGFSKKDAQFIASKIRVDNGRSAGHAWSASTPYDLQLLRVRIPKEGIDENGFSTYMHELGHCVEGVLSKFYLDYKSLWGIPNTALTEAFAFTFQDRSDEVLGRKFTPNHDVKMLQRFWEAFEIAAPALVEIRLFHWLYKHPKATALQIHKQIRAIGDAVWTEYHEPIFGSDSYGLPAVYSHILWGDLYLADYVLGYVTAHQIRSFLKGKVLGKEMPRMCAPGCVYPDVWMKNAVGAPIDAKPLLRDVRAALGRV